MDAFSDDDCEILTRRNFLKRFGTGAAAFLMHPFVTFNDALKPSAEPLLPAGRILGASINMYDRPSESGKLIKVVWRDLVLPITRATLGDIHPSYNRVWYEINGEGYIHSGNVQPVEILHNPVLPEVPREGLLAQVTVPYTDTVWNPRHPNRYAYRLYYSTTYWIKGVHQDDSGQSWYRVWDDKWGFSYFAKAEHLRLVLPEEIAPLSPEIPAENKRLEVRLEAQAVVAYEYDRPVFMTRVATGARFRDGNYQTPKGSYITNRKRPSRHMAAGDPAASSSYDLPGIPWVCYLTKSGISFHGTYWHNDFGRPRSHGCINCSSSAARWIYRWTLPSVPISEETWAEDTGTTVDVIP